MPSAQSSPLDAGSMDGSVSAARDADRTSTSDPNASGSGPWRANSRGDEGDDGPALSVTLSANRIIALVHEKPEVAVDLKEVMSEYFLKQGIAVSEDSISDDVLFSNLVSNPDLRRAISVWLRARDLVPDLEFGDPTLQPRDMEQPSPNGRATPLNRVGDLDADTVRELALRDLPADAALLPRDGTAVPMTGRPEMLEPRRKDDPRSSLSQKTARSSSRDNVSATPRDAPRPDAVEVVRQPTPYNLQSLRDLYTQVPEQSVKVKRFGSDVFFNHGPATKEMPVDLPIGPDYVLGPGDSVTISMWGGMNQTFTRTVDREGRLVLPEAGPVVVAGLTLERTQTLVQGELGRQFKDARVVVSVGHLRTVRIYVVGDVQRPGAYDISSLSTPLNALYAAGGPTSAGSLRTVRHMRGSTLVREVDLYEFLRNGLRMDTERLEPGDTILVPPVGPQVEVTGMVKRPAIYEFKTAAPLSQVIEEAGGLLPAAALTHIRIERIGSDGHRSTTEVELAPNSTVESAHSRMDAFLIKDGDRVAVAPILPYSERAIYVAGHVVRPGKMPYRDGMTLKDVLHSYQDMLPEPSDRGEIIRLMPPDLRPEAIEFSVSDVVAGNPSASLQPFDTVHVRGRYEGDAPRVTIRGEVLRPGPYALTQTMTAAQLVRIAGGFRRSALLADADLASYEIRDGRQVVSRRSTIAIGEAVAGVGGADVPLKPGDVLTVHQISGWNDIGASVTLTGEVVYPGTYGLQEGERLSSVIRRAGGFRTTAYPDGAVMVRLQVKELEQKSRAELIRQIETTSAGARMGSSVTGNEDTGVLQLLIQQQNQVLQGLRSQPVVGRLVIKIGSDLAQWQDKPADIELRAGDMVNIPKRPGFVLVSGQAYNASAITFVPGKNAGWYLSHAGGATNLANRKEIFVIRANGVVVGRRSGEWYQNVLSTQMSPGDVVVVPQKIIGGSVFWKNTLATAQVVSAIAFTAALALH